MGFLNRAAGTRPLERVGFAVAVACLCVVVLWIGFEHTYYVGDGIRDALIAAWPGTSESRGVPVSWACKGFFLGLVLRFLARPFSRWIFSAPSAKAPEGNEKHKNSTAAKVSTKSGVGGWLAILVAGLLVLGPLICVGRLRMDIEDAEHLYPTLLGLPAWGDYKNWLWGITLAAILISMTAGWRLLKGRDVGAVRFAQIALWVSGPVASALLGWILPMVKLGNAAISEQGLSAIIASSVSAALWTFYLARSQRVKNTYRVRPPTSIVVL